MNKVFFHEGTLNLLYLNNSDTDMYRMKHFTVRKQTCLHCNLLLCIVWCMQQHSTHKIEDET